MPSGAVLRAILAIVGLAVILGVMNVVTSGHFLQPNNLVNVLRQIAVNAVLAVGQTFVIITAGIDLSVGSLIALAGVLAAGAMRGAPNDIVGLLLALSVALGVGAAAGTVNALPVVRFNLPPFITTLAMMLMARGTAFLYTGGRPIEIDNQRFNSIADVIVLHAGGATLNTHVPLSVLIMLAVVTAGAYLLTQTPFGRYVFAIGGNEEAARLSGINVALVKTGVFAISGALAGLASILLAARLNSGIPQSGLGYELQCIAAVVVGGTSLAGGRGSIAGTFVGALLIGILYNLMNLLNVQSYAQEVILGAVILFAVLLDELRKRYLSAR